MMEIRTDFKCTAANTCTLTYQHALSNAMPTLELQKTLKKYSVRGKKANNFSIEVKQHTKKKNNLNWVFMMLSLQLAVTDKARPLSRQLQPSKPLAQGAAATQKMPT